MKADVYINNELVHVITENVCSNIQVFDTRPSATIKVTDKGEVFVYNLVRFASRDMVDTTSREITEHRSYFCCKK